MNPSNEMERLRDKGVINYSSQNEVILMLKVEGRMYEKNVIMN